MKKLLLFMAVFVAISILPFSAYASDHHDHDQQWKNNHNQQWKDNDKEWRDHDREWREHRNDRDWREEHARMWPDWYQWHREDDGDNDFGIHISIGDFDIDVN